MRPKAGGQGSYDTILPKYKKLVSEREDQNYYIRGTFTAKNLDFSKDVLHMKELGFTQVSIEPVVLEENSEYALNVKDLPKIFEEYDKLTEIMVEIQKKDEFFNFFHFMIDLDQGPCVVKRVKGCGCGNEYVAITPDGDIFPCHRFVDRPELKMGNVNNNFDINKDMQAKYIKTTVLDKPECEACWAKYFCSGGCSANNFIFNNDIMKAHKLSCELEKKRIECAIYLQAVYAE